MRMAILDMRAGRSFVSNKSPTTVTNVGHTTDTAAKCSIGGFFGLPPCEEE